MSELHERVLDWYDEFARPLPWRDASASAWEVLVSEVMLQQTPVVRVLPVYEQWMRCWPTPGDLAASSSGQAIRAWGRLGYPRRALRLHQAATVIVTHHEGRVPSSLEALRALPGVGAYTAAAVASFAFGQRHTVLDTNVRRVLARAVTGAEFPTGSVTAAERRLAVDLLPPAAHTAARWAAAVMELGALVCSARSPRCTACPVADLCVWRSAGYPSYDGPPRRGQTYAGTDRQCRGRLLEALRVAPGPMPRARLDLVWDQAEQRNSCLRSLCDDRLVERLADDTYTLPGVTGDPGS